MGDFKVYLMINPPFTALRPYSVAKIEQIPVTGTSGQGESRKPSSLQLYKVEGRRTKKGVQSSVALPPGPPGHTFRCSRLQFCSCILNVTMQLCDNKLLFICSVPIAQSASEI